MAIVDKALKDVNLKETQELADTFIAFIQDQIDFHRNNAEKYSEDPNPYRSAKHKETAADFRDLRDFVRHQDMQLRLRKYTETKRPLLALSPEDIEGLPKEQLEQLSITSADKAEFSILAMLEASGGIMSLDQIIVGLFRETSEIQMRAKITARLYRMAQKGMLHSVPTKKGVYSLRKINEKKAEAMFKGILVDTKSNSAATE